MDNLGFLLAAYAVTFVVLVGYTWSLHRRLGRSRRQLRTESSSPEKR